MELILVVSSVLLWIVVLFNLLLTVAVIRRGSARPSGFDMVYATTLEIGAQAPDFIAETLDGENVSMATYAGQAVAFIFVSPICSPCLEKIPILNTLGPQAKMAGVELVLVNIADRAQTKTFVKEHDIRLPILVAPKEINPFITDYKVVRTPFFCLIDKESKVRSTGFLGGDDWNRLAEEWNIVPALSP